MLNRGKGSQILVLSATSAQAKVTQAKRIIDLIIDDERSSTEKHNSNDEVEWHISNRYYEVDVSFKISQNEIATSSRSTNKVKQIPRKARIKPDSAENDESSSDLDQKARDVFEALQLGPPPSIQKIKTDALQNEKERSSDENLVSLHEELKGIQAVLIIVNRDQSLSEHERLLNILKKEIEEEPLLSGFDLGISLVVGLPSPLNDSSEPVTLSTVSNSEEVEDLYAGEGWEYIDLAKVERYAESDQETDEDDRESFSIDQDDEKYGIERVREALMNHAWPGLIRKQDRRQALMGIGEGEIDQENIEIDELLASTLTSLHLNLNAIDNKIGMAQPTEKDEELARAFMARIQAAQEAGVGETKGEAGSVTTAGATKSISDMQSALENFLENIEPESFASRPQESDDAWGVKETRTAGTNQKNEFEDDFTDFVQADESTNKDDQEFLGFQDALDENDLNFIGDADDALLMQALAEREKDRNVFNGNDVSSDVPIDFESTLQAVLAHAERIRAIPDQDKRREEAARIALALTDQ